MGEVTMPIADTVEHVWKLIDTVNRDVEARWPRIRYRTIFVNEGYVPSSTAKHGSIRLPDRLGAALVQELTSLVDEVHEQMPSAKAVVTDERLRRHGLWVPFQPHAMDAVRHSVVRLRMLSA